MTYFTTRVELHSATEPDYEILHAAMGKEGYTRTIKSDNGTIHKLPTAEYNLEGNFTIQEAYDKAERAAATTKKKNWILVSEALRRKFKLEIVPVSVKA